MAAWVGLGVLVGCGVQSVDYPTDGLGTGDGGNISPGGDGGAGGCVSNSQCTGGKVCTAGVCGACTANSQCSPGQVCAGGICGQCTATTQCDPGLQCVAGACAGNAGDSGVTIDGADPSCASGYVGQVGPVGSVWGNPIGGAPSGFGPAAGGATGLQAGNNACAAVFAGSHACTWEEVKHSDVCGKLTQLKNTADTAWMHRTGAETAPTATGAAPGTTNVVDDNPSLQPGLAAKGARCNDWTYPTNHAFDGEFIEFGGGVMKGHLDSDTADLGDNGVANSPHAAAGVLQCSTENRKVLCCK
jgi:hypothetical protein